MIVGSEDDERPLAVLLGVTDEPNFNTAWNTKQKNTYPNLNWQIEKHNREARESWSRIQVGCRIGG